MLGVSNQLLQRLVTRLLLVLFATVLASSNKAEKQPLVTFIVSSFGRWTLERTLKSLIKQTDPSWRAIVALDGSAEGGNPGYISTSPAYLTLPSMILTETRIEFLMMPLTGSYRFGGYVRNKALEYVESPWIGFVDDDDALSNQYVALL